MTTTLISGDDIRYLVQQDTSALTTTMGQMTTLLQDITDLQNDSDSRVEAMEKQGWFKRMWNTITGKNKATVKELQKNQDKVVTYVSEAVSNLYNMNCIDQQVICSLGNRMNQIYAQVTDVYQEQLQMKAQIAELQQIQQQTLQALGNFVTTLNEKIESVDNFHMLTTEIQQGRYNDPSSLYSLCCVLAQLDKRTLEDERKCSILREALVQSQIVHEDGITVRQYMEEILALPENKVGVVYLELCNFRESFPANLFAEMIENYHFLSKMEKMSKKKDVLVQRILEQYELDDSAEFSSLDVFESFLENKQESIANVENIRIATADTESNLEEQNAASNREEQNAAIIEKAMDMTSGSNPDFKAAIDYVRPLAEQGFAAAQSFLGYCYGTGHGVEKNRVEAAKWYQKAAEQGSAEAQLNLGRCYEDGDGVEKNEFEAVKWYRKAAEQGYIEAQYALGLCYDYGMEVEDRTEAAKWYQKAAEQGYAEAQFSLGQCYFYGNGVNKNKFEAAKWYQKAADQGHEAAQEFLDENF